MTTLFIRHSSKDKAWAERTHAALADGGYQCLFLDSHPDDGIHAGADWEQTLYQRLRQSRGVVVLCSANWLASPWCVAEAMMSRERGKRVFLVAAAGVADDRQVKLPDGTDARRIPGFLKDSQLVSLGDVTEEEACRRLLHGLEKEGLKKRDFKRPGRPYPGLAPFQETDAAVYFGRDDEIDELLAVLTRRRNNAHGFILVLGPSGCGKSSLVRAGVLPRLGCAGGDDGAPKSWVIVPPVMGGRGLDGLALSLASAFRDADQAQDFAALRGRLGAPDDLRSLGSDLLNVRDAPDGAVLLVLDQLEEVFGTADGSEARALLRLLLDGSADAGSPMVVLATMRSDFLNAFQLFEVAHELRYEKVTLEPMPRSRFAEVIEGPADRFGLDLDPGLAERMAADTAYSDALPLLAFTLEKLFEKCEPQGRLILATYDELGGVDASVKHAADAILTQEGYAGLDETDERMRDLRRAFYRLAQVGEEGQFTRRIARWSQMPDACKPVLQRFVDQRLLVSDTANGETVLGVAHEALFRVWDALHGWLDKDRKALVLRAQIEDAAGEWEREHRAESRAWAEERVLDAVREIQVSGVSLPKTVDAFLGPTNPEDLEALPGLGHGDDAAKGSGRFGEAWRLPLGHVARASVGVRLAILDDRRKGVGLREGLPDIDWVPINGGEVTIEIRADPNDQNSKVVDCLTRSVAPLRMSRYLVTIAQFRAFLNDCYRDGQWRLPPGFPADLLSSYSRPKPRARSANRPVESVNWFDACAFCHSLSAGLGYEVRLPTEFEWQLAATGGDAARRYPWGPVWNPAQEPWKANTQESELGRSTAVGMYPAGASSAGVLDMAGTVWEWCLNLFENPEVTDFSRFKEPRVLRGGSWRYSQNYARPAASGAARTALLVSVWCVRPHLLDTEH